MVKLGHKAASYIGLLAAISIGVSIGYVLGNGRSNPSAPATVPVVERAAIEPGLSGSRAVVKAVSDQPGDSSPHALTQTSAPRLLVDAQGRLQRVRAVRDFFDYFLSAQSELSPAALDELVRHALETQLAGRPAMDEARALWMRYKAYRNAAAQSMASATSLNTGKDTAEAMQRLLDARASMASRMLGEWAQPFFAADTERRRYGLARAAIELDGSLSAREKASRFQALESTLAPEQREKAASGQQQIASIDMLVRSERQGTSDANAVTQQIAQQLGTETADRFASMTAGEKVWQETYARYAAAAAAMRTQYADENQLRAQIAKLRAQYFPNAADAVRASSLDDTAAR